MPYLGIFGREFWTTIVISEIRTLWIFQNIKLVQNKKTSNLVPKMFYMGISKLKFEKIFCYIWNQHLEFVKNGFLAETVNLI